MPCLVEYWSLLCRETFEFGITAVQTTIYRYPNHEEQRMLCTFFNTMRNYIFLLDFSSVLAISYQFGGLQTAHIAHFICVYIYINKETHLSVFLLNCPGFYSSLSIDLPFQAVFHCFCYPGHCLSGKKDSCRNAEYFLPIMTPPLLACHLKNTIFLLARITFFQAWSLPYPWSLLHFWEYTYVCFPHSITYLLFLCSHSNLRRYVFRKTQRPTINHGR